MDMMAEPKERIKALKERHERYVRVFTPELLRTLKECDEDLGLLQSSATLLKAGLHSDIVLVLSGMRDYSNHLSGLVGSTKATIDSVQKQIDEEKRQLAAEEKLRRTPR